MEAPRSSTPAQPVSRYRRLTAAIRAKPTFIIVGAQKAATSTLFDALTKSPAVGGALVKETHFFSLHHHLGKAYYRSLFPLRPGIQRLIQGKPFHACGEATPYYLFHPLAAKRISELSADIKIVACLRDPALRAVSMYRYQKSRGLEHRSFEQCLDQELPIVEHEEQRLAEEEIQSSTVHQYHSYFSRGLYAKQLQRYYGLFPREHIHLLDYNDLANNPRSFYQSLTDFLNLPSLSDSAVQKKVNRTVDRDQSLITEKSIENLRERYHSPDRDLEALAGRRFSWMSR